MYDPIIYGKNQIENIVSIEPGDAFAEIFTEVNGVVSSQFVPNRYWILANEKIGKNFVRLKGNQHYCWGNQYDERSEFLKWRSIFKKQDIFSIYNPKESLMVKDGYTYFKNMKPNDPSLLSFDIETTGLDPNAGDALIIMISCYYRNGSNVEQKLFSIDEFKSEAEMLEFFAAWFVLKNPTLIIGHNVLSYDLPYLAARAERNGVVLNLGRNGSSIAFDNYESKFRKDQTQFYEYKNCHIYGREIIDTLFLSIKHDVATKKYESYRLKHIVEVEGLERKDREFYDASQIRHKYKIPEEMEKIKRYCIHDAEDAVKLYDLMIPSFFYMTQSIPKSFQAVVSSATGSQINSIMMRSYLQEGNALPKADEAMSYEGAISIGNSGIYRNVQKWDVASLYPSIMIEHNVYDKTKDPKANMQYMLRYFTEKRLEYKKLYKETGDLYYKAMDTMSKVLINSVYGFTGTSGLLFNSPSIASFVTKTGRDILRKSFDWAKEKNLVIVNADTDSISVCRENQSFIPEKERSQLQESLNSIYPDRISWADDGYFPTFIVVKAKNYILYDGESIKYKGSSLVASTKEPALREFIHKVVESIVYETGGVEEIYKKYVLEANSITDIKRWVSRKAITEAVMTSERANETKVLEAIKGTEYVIGDRVYLYFKPDESLGLAENFDGHYHKGKMLEKLYKTGKLFSTIMNTEELFPNLSLKKNRFTLNDMLGLTPEVSFKVKEL